MKRHPREFDRPERAFHASCHPMTAAVLSVIPGLGQLYVGERRKGIVFLDVTAVNAVLLWLMLFTEPLIRTMKELASQFHFRLNAGVVEVMQGAHAGTPASLLIIAMMIAFVLFAARDAYDQAFGGRRKQIYGNSLMELSEATSGSYIIHFTLLTTFGLMAIFFLVPPHRAAQIVEITFTDTQPIPTHNKILAKTMSTVNAAAHGHKEINKPVAPDKQTLKRTDTQPTTAHNAPPQPVIRPHPVKALPPPPKSLASTPQKISLNKTALEPMSASKSMQHILPAPVIRPSNPTNSTQPAPLTAPISERPANSHSLAPPGTIINNSLLAQLPLPGKFIRSTGNAAANFQPKLPANGAAINSNGAPPIGTISQANSGNVAPTIPATAAGTKSPGDFNGPAPIAARSQTGPIGTWSVTPRTGGERAGTADGNHDNSRPQTATISTDFGPYMANLQRRIKRHWFPRPDQQSRKVTVRFALNTEGELSRLSLVRSCGDTLADKTALDAVSNAGPFPHLPPNAPESIDIEFTFDYNVFSARGLR